MLEALELQLIDYPNIQLQGAEIQIPFHVILKLEHYGETVLRAQQSDLLVFNIYDNWTESISNFTAFNRMILLLRSLHVDIQKSIGILMESNSSK